MTGRWISEYFFLSPALLCRSAMLFFSFYRLFRLNFFHPLSFSTSISESHFLQLGNKKYLNIQNITYPWYATLRSIQSAEIKRSIQRKFQLKNADFSNVTIVIQCEKSRINRTVLCQNANWGEDERQKTKKKSKRKENCP